MWDAIDLAYGVVVTLGLWVIVGQTVAIGFAAVWALLTVLSAIGHLAQHRAKSDDEQ